MMFASLGLQRIEAFKTQHRKLKRILVDLSLAVLPDASDQHAT